MSSTEQLDVRRRASEIAAPMPQWPMRRVGNGMCGCWARHEAAVQPGGRRAVGSRVRHRHRRGRERKIWAQWQRVHAQHFTAPSDLAASALFPGGSDPFSLPQAHCPVNTVGHSSSLCVLVLRYGYIRCPALLELQSGPTSVYLHFFLGGKMNRAL